MRVRALRGLLAVIVMIAGFTSVVRASPDDGSQIDVLVLIGHNARAIAGGTDRLAVGFIEAAFDSVNQGYATAGVNTQVRIVGYQPVFFLEQVNGDPNTDLNALIGTIDGVLDEVHALRNAYAADIVVLVAGAWFAIYDGNGHSVPPFDDDYRVYDPRNALHRDAGCDPVDDARARRRCAAAVYHAADRRAQRQPHHRRQLSRVGFANDWRGRAGDQWRV